MVKVTCHGKQRVKDRIGLSKNLSASISEKALEYGMKHCETKGKLKKYYDCLYLKHKTANNIRIYHEKVFIFSDNTLITILDLPNNLKRDVLNQRNKSKQLKKA